MDRWLLVVQSLAFRPEIESVIAGRPLPARSTLRRFTSIRDNSSFSLDCHTNRARACCSPAVVLNTTRKHGQVS